MWQRFLLQSPHRFRRPFLNAFYGLFHTWICAINLKHLGNVLSKPARLWVITAMYCHCGEKWSKKPHCLTLSHFLGNTMSNIAVHYVDWVLGINFECPLTAEILPQAFINSVKLSWADLSDMSINSRGTMCWAATAAYSRKKWVWQQFLGGVTHCEMLFKFSLWI